MKSKGIHMITFLLLVIGGLNWLLVGISGWEIGQLFGGQGAAISRIIYLLIGLSAIYELISHKKCCKECSNGASKPASPAAPAPPTPPTPGA